MKTTNEPITTDINCPQCKEMTVMKILKVDIPGEVATLISSITCAKCNYRDNSVHDGDIGTGTGVKIKIKAKTKDDIMRYIRLSENSEVRLRKNNYEFIYHCSVSGIYLIESIIRSTITKYTAAYDIEQKMTASSFGETTDYVNPELEGKQKAEAQAALLRSFLKDYDFEMELIDDTGISRIAPVGKLPGEIESDDISFFNDEQVQHTFYQVQNREEI